MAKQRLRGLAVVGAVMASSIVVVRGARVNDLPVAYSGTLTGDNEVRVPHPTPR